VAIKSKRVSDSAIEVLRAGPLAKIPWLVHGFSTRQGGTSRVYGGNALNLGYTSHDSSNAVERNRSAFARVVASAVRGSTKSSRAWPIITARQIHSDLIRCVSANPAQIPAADGLITRTAGILLGVLAADCLAVIVADTTLHAVGVFHAGWKGTLKRMVEKGVGEMQRNFSSRPRDLKAAIGPGIRGCCYDVGPELREKFAGQFSYAEKLFRETKLSDEVREKYPLLFLSARAPGHSELPKKIFLDLAEANRRQLIDAGIPAKNIVDLQMCTSCRRDLFFSHRAERGITGRMMAVVGVRK